MKTDDKFYVGQRQSMCIDCHAVRFRERYHGDATFREQQLAASARYRRQQFERKYGITADAFDELVIAQAGRCLICEQGKVLVPDHCHTSGRFRGAICHTCNRVLGLMGDDPIVLRRAADYLASVGQPA